MNTLCYHCKSCIEHCNCQDKCWQDHEHSSCDVCFLTSEPVCDTTQPVVCNCFSDKSRGSKEWHCPQHGNVAEVAYDNKTVIPFERQPARPCTQCNSYTCYGDTCREAEPLSSLFCFTCNHCWNCKSEPCGRGNTHVFGEGGSAICRKCSGPNEIERLRKENAELKHDYETYKSKVSGVMNGHNKFMRAMYVLNDFHKQQMTVEALEEVKP